MPRARAAEAKRISVDELRARGVSEDFLAPAQCIDAAVPARTDISTASRTTFVTGGVAVTEDTLDSVRLPGVMEVIESRSELVGLQDPYAKGRAKQWSVEEMVAEYGVGYRLLAKMGYAGGGAAPLTAVKRHERVALQDDEAEAVDRAATRKMLKRPQQARVPARQQSQQDKQVDAQPVSQQQVKRRRTSSIVEHDLYMGMRATWGLSAVSNEDDNDHDGGCGFYVDTVGSAVASSAVDIAGSDEGDEASDALGAADGEDGESRCPESGSDDDSEYCKAVADYAYLLEVQSTTASSDDDDDDDDRRMRSSRLISSSSFADSEAATLSSDHSEFRCHGCGEGFPSRGALRQHVADRLTAWTTRDPTDLSARFDAEHYDREVIVSMARSAQAALGGVHWTCPVCRWCSQDTDVMHLLMHIVEAPHQRLEHERLRMMLAEVLVRKPAVPVEASGAPARPLATAPSPVSLTAIMSRSGSSRVPDSAAAAAAAAAAVQPAATATSSTAQSTSVRRHDDEGLLENLLAMMVGVEDPVDVQGVSAHLQKQQSFASLGEELLGPVEHDMFSA